MSTLRQYVIYSTDLICSPSGDMGLHLCHSLHSEREAYIIDGLELLIVL